MESKTIAKKIYILALGIFLLDLSLLYVNKTGIVSLNSAILTQFSISIIFGFFHGYKKFIAAKNVTKSATFLDLLSQFLIYTAWYNVVLLPLSGIGLLEWILVSAVLFSDFICSISGKRDSRLSYIGNSDLNLIMFGSLLAIFKSIVFYIFPNNIYLESFTGNGAARLLILFFCVIGLFFLISFLIKTAKSKSSLNNKITYKKSDKKIKIFFNKIKNAFFALVSGPSAIVILLCIFFFAGIFVFAIIKSVSNDILEFIEPYLIKLSSTGKNSITVSITYYFCQIFVTAAVLVYDRISKEHLEGISKAHVYNLINQNLTNMKLSTLEKDYLLDKTNSLLLENKNYVDLSQIDNAKIQTLILENKKNN